MTCFHVELVDHVETSYRVYEVKLSYAGGWHEDVSLIALSCAAVALWADGIGLEELLLSPSFGCSTMRMQRCGLGRVLRAPSIHRRAMAT
jgi:hypothetical protein